MPYIKNALRTYVKIEDRHVSLIPAGCYIRYINRETGELLKGVTVYKQYDPLHEKYKFILWISWNQEVFSLKQRQIYFLPKTAQ